MPSNPYYAYVTLTIGETTFELGTSNILSMTCTRFTSTTNNTCTIEILDETALAIEALILEQGAERKASYSYGYTNGLSSPVYSGMITECEPDLTPSGATLTITIVSSGSLCKGRPKQTSYRGTPDEVVTQVAEEEGWFVGTIEPCNPVLSDGAEPDGNNNVSRTSKVYYRNNLSAIDFIKKEVQPYAISSITGVGDFKTYFDDSSSTPTLNFHPDKWESNERVMYEFQIGQNGYSEVLSFKPGFNEVLSSVLGASEVSATSVDKLRNEMFSTKYDKTSNPSRPVVGDYNDTLPGCTYPVGGSSYTQDELEKLSANLWYRGASATYPAELSVVGNPQLNIQSIISMIVLTPQGLPHYSSGIYLITSITDEITGGSFTTNVALIRNALNVGDDGSGGVNITAGSPPVLSGSNGSNSSGSQTPNNTGGNSGGMTTTNAVVETAKKYLGVPYVWGGTTPQGFDCSGLTQYAYAQNGITISRVTYTQCKEGTDVPAGDSSKWLPGDLLFYYPGSSGPEHVGMYVGNGQKIHAPQTGDVVKIDGAGSPCIVRRILK